MKILYLLLLQWFVTYLHIRITWGCNVHLLTSPSRYSDLSISGWGLSIGCFENIPGYSDVRPGLRDIAQGLCFLLICCVLWSVFPNPALSLWESGIEDLFRSLLAYLVFIWSSYLVSLISTFPTQPCDICFVHILSSQANLIAHFSGKSSVTHLLMNCLVDK